MAISKEKKYTDLGSKRVKDENPNLTFAVGHQLVLSTESFPLRFVRVPLKPAF